MGIRYKKLYKALELCAGPECCTECPYHGETRGGMTCRARLLGDAAVALAIEETRANEAEIERDDLREKVDALAEALELAEDTDRPAEPKEYEMGLAEMAEIVLEATRNAEYWRGRAEALEWCMGLAMEADDVPPVEGAEGDV